MDAGTIATASINWTPVLLSILVGLSGFTVYMIQRGISRNDDEKKDIKETIDSDREAFNLKLEKAADLFNAHLTTIAAQFGGQLKEAVGTFMSELKEVKVTMDGLAKSVTELSNTMRQIEKDSTLRYDAFDKKLTDTDGEIKRLRDFRHETENATTRFELRTEVNSRNIEKIMQENKEVRTDGFGRIEKLEMKQASTEERLKEIEEEKLREEGRDYDRRKKTRIK